MGNIYRSSLLRACARLETYNKATSRHTIQKLNTVFGALGEKHGSEASGSKYFLEHNIPSKNNRYFI